MISGGVDAAAGKAVALLRTTAHGGGVEAVLSLLDRASPRDDLPYPPYQALAYLLERGVASEHVVGHFRTFSNVMNPKGFRSDPFLGKYAVLALRYVPSVAMDLVRRALRSSPPIGVADIVAVLSAVNHPWCLREMRTALAENPRQQVIAHALQNPPVGGAETLGSDDAHSPVGEVSDDLRGRYPPEWTG